MFQIAIELTNDYIFSSSMCTTCVHAITIITIYVTRLIAIFAKMILIHESDFATLMTHNFVITYKP